MLLIRAVFDKYFNDGYDVLKEGALKMSLKARGLQESNYKGLIDIFKEEPQIVHLTQLINE